MTEIRWNDKRGMRPFDEILAIKLPVVQVVPTVESKIKNRQLILVYKSGLIRELTSYDGDVRCSVYQSLAEFEKSIGSTIKDYDDITTKKLGRAIREHFPEIIEVREGVL